jgi:hypothetical protein
MNNIVLLFVCLLLGMGLRAANLGRRRIKAAGRHARSAGPGFGRLATQV